MRKLRETKAGAGAGEGEDEDVARQQAKAVTGRNELLRSALKSVLEVMDGIDEKKDQADFARDMKQVRDLLRRYLPADRMGEQRTRQPRSGAELVHLLEQRGKRPSALRLG